MVFIPKTKLLFFLVEFTLNHFWEREETSFAAKERVRFFIERDQDFKLQLA